MAVLIEMLVVTLTKSSPADLRRPHRPSHRRALSGSSRSLAELVEQVVDVPDQRGWLPSGELPQLLQYLACLRPYSSSSMRPVLKSMSSWTTLDFSHLARSLFSASLAIRLHSSTIAWKVIFRMK